MTLLITSMNKFLLLGLWPLATVTTLTLAMALFFVSPIATMPSVKGAQTNADVEVQKNYKQFTAETAPDNTMTQAVTVNDARVEIVRQFLKRYDSPLEPHAKQLVETAEKHHLDFRLLPAVAMQESTLCRTIPMDSYNCWGYGIYGDKILRFTSYEDAIEKVALGLSEDYAYEGLTTPEQIMSRYTPSSNGSWADAVRHFMEEME